MLIIQATDDPLIQQHQGASMAAKLEGLGKAVEYVEIEFGGHSIDNVGGRAVVLKSLEVFLEQYIGDHSQSASRQSDAGESEQSQAAN
jgi:predicted esterase